MKSTHKPDFHGCTVPIKSVHAEIIFCREDKLLIQSKSKLPVQIKLHPYMKYRTALEWYTFQRYNYLDTKKKKQNAPRVGLNYKKNCIFGINRIEL